MRELSVRKEIHMQKSDKYILFGAGLTGLATLQYYGHDRIAAVIDNDRKKIGHNYEGIPIISFETYLKEYKDNLIILSIYSNHYFDCIEQIKNNGIRNYFTSPPVLYGLETPEEFAQSNKLTECDHVVFYGSNPITERIEAYIKKTCSISIDYIDNQLSRIEGTKGRIKLENLQNEDTLVLTTNEMEDPIRKKLNRRFIGKIVDIYQYQEERKEQYRELEKYKNRYIGKRCFVIGNGPSLRPEDLMRLEEYQEISFAANGIFHIYDKVLWRPTHYMLCDAVAYKIMYKDIKKIENKNAFIADFCYTDLPKINKANRFYLINKLSNTNRFEFSTDVVKGLYSGRTITYVMIQLACYMGIKEIYLLGVDWTGGKGTGVSRTDFYEGENARVENNSAYDMFDEEKYAFESALEYADAHEIKIWNATRGGELEVFERVDFDSLFDK